MTIVQDCIAAAIDHGKPHLERYVAEHLQHPESFPLMLAEPGASIREIRRLKITLRFRGHYPPLGVT